MSKKHTVESSEVIEGQKPTIDEWLATQRSTRCSVCSQPQEIRDLVDNGLRSGKIGSVRLWRYLTEVRGIQISEPSIAHHKKAQHHLTNGAETA